MISRNFLLIGIVYVLCGMVLGGYMGASGNHALTGAHAHINLVGFVMMVLFGLCYKVFPALAENGMARLHFWLHQVSALILSVGLLLMLSGTLPEATMGPILLIAEIGLIGGTALFGLNVLKNV
jgi:hypothetical protein